VIGYPHLLRAALLRSLKWYLARTPIRYGRTRLTSWATHLVGQTPQPSYASDGRKFMLQFPRDRGWEQVWLRGTFETGTVNAVRQVLRPNDVTFDVGANIGWYTTLFAQHCPSGQCHAFEPEPNVFVQLAENCALNGIAERVTLNNIGVSDVSGPATLYRFPNLSHGHSSMSFAVAPGARATACQLTTLDRYCAEGRIDRVDLIKVDVEGAELSVLRGATQLFARRSPPIWLLEVNFQTSRAFGYTPFELLRFVEERVESRFYRVVEGWGQLIVLRHFHQCVHGDNVLCVPLERLERVAGFP